MPPTKRRDPVIVVLGEKGEKTTFVDKKNVNCILGPPSTYAEAIFQRHPKMEEALRALCQDLTKCQIREVNYVDTLALIIQQEQNKTIELQAQLVSETKYKLVNFQENT
eukprot:660258-Ditylum_brightwellii.AAC.1